MFNPMDSDEEDEFDRIVAQSRSIEDAPRRLKMMEVSQDASIHSASIVHCRSEGL